MFLKNIEKYPYLKVDTVCVIMGGKSVKKVEENINLMRLQLMLFADFNFNINFIMFKMRTEQHEMEGWV